MDSPLGRLLCEAAANAGYSVLDGDRGLHCWRLSVSVFEVGESAREVCANLRDADPAHDQFPITCVRERGGFIDVKISRASTYAILAACQLSDSKSSPPVPCSRLAKLGRMPERFLLQVLRSLVRHGILSSTRGVDGGYRLNRPASEISLLDVIEATDGPLRPATPELSPLSAKAQERVAQAFSGIAVDAKQRLSQVKLSQLKPAPKK